jgi:hypothetical protein
VERATLSLRLILCGRNANAKWVTYVKTNRPDTDFAADRGPRHGEHQDQILIGLMLCDNNHNVKEKPMGSASALTRDTVYLVIITHEVCYSVMAKLGLRDEMSFHYHSLWAAVSLSTPFTGFFLTKTLRM